MTVKSGNRATYRGVATENFIITTQAESVDDADLVGDYMVKTRGELKAMGPLRPQKNDTARLHATEPRL